MPRIIPIRDLKETSIISKMCHENADPIYITKNGYGDMVIMDIDYFNRCVNSLQNNQVYSFNEIIKILYPIFQEYNVKSAILFGSYAKGLANENSDIDLVVETDLKGIAFYGLLEEISSKLNKEIDLIEKREIVPNSKVDLEIKKSGIRIYG